MRLFNNVTQLSPTPSRSLRDEKPTDGEYVDDSVVQKSREPRRLIQRKGPTNQPHVSEAEIRQKLKESTTILNKRKVQQEMMTKETSTFMQEEGAGDVAKNDPKNPVTVGKLKDLMNNGGFSFSDKERSVLAEILKDR